jgi:hypothetical protein
MKKLALLLVFSFVTLGIAAQNAMPETETPTPTTTKPVKKKKKWRKKKTTAVAAKTQQTTNVKYRLGLSFISYGAGTDGKVYQKVDSFFKAQPKKLICVDQPWGREGEMDRFYTLKELNEQAQSELIVQLKQLCKGNEMVIISENVENQRQRR